MKKFRTKHILCMSFKKKIKNGVKYYKDFGKGKTHYILVWKR